MNYEVPKKYCKAGHLIPLNGDVVGEERDAYGVIHPKVLKSPRLICEECAMLASGGEILEGVKHRPVRGKKLEKLGQESFLGTVPAKFYT